MGSHRAQHSRNNCVLLGILKDTNIYIYCFTYKYLIVRGCEHGLMMELSLHFFKQQKQAGSTSPQMYFGCSAGVNPDGVQGAWFPDRGCLYIQKPSICPTYLCPPVQLWCLCLSTKHPTIVLLTLICSCVIFSLSPCFFLMSSTVFPFKQFILSFHFHTFLTSSPLHHCFAFWFAKRGPYYTA